MLPRPITTLSLVCKPPAVERDRAVQKLRARVHRLRLPQTNMSIHQRLISKLSAMPNAQVMVGASAAMGFGSFCCCMVYNTIYKSGTPGTWNSSLWTEATNAYMKYQVADPMSYPEVRGK